MLLVFALFTGGAAIERWEKGNEEVAYFLAAITLILVLGGVVQWVLDRDG